MYLVKLQGPWAFCVCLGNLLNSNFWLFLSVFSRLSFHQPPEVCTVCAAALQEFPRWHPSGWPLPGLGRAWWCPRGRREWCLWRDTTRCLKCMYRYIVSIRNKRTSTYDTVFNGNTDFSVQIMPFINCAKQFLLWKSAEYIFCLVM